jgi:hypothetical protein
MAVSRSKAKAMSHRKAHECLRSAFSAGIETNVSNLRSRSISVFETTEVRIGEIASEMNISASYGQNYLRPYRKYFNLIKSQSEATGLKSQPVFFMTKNKSKIKLSFILY